MNMEDKSFTDLIDDIEKAMSNLKETPRRDTQYDEETVLVIDRKKHDKVMKTLRELERAYYKGD